MAPKKSNGKWWLVAVLAPPLVFGTGLVLPLPAQAYENDWAYKGRIALEFGGLIAGCLISCVAAGISAFKREKFWPTGLLAGALSLCSLPFVALLLMNRWGISIG
jgi:hypothetical protein